MPYTEASILQQFLAFLSIYILSPLFFDIPLSLAECAKNNYLFIYFVFKNNFYFMYKQATNLNPREAK